MRNPFVQPTHAQDRVKAAQVCPHCFAPLLSLWGEDLRKKGRCPDCGRRVFRLKGVMHSVREMAVAGAALAGVAVVAVGWVVVSMWS